jgi:hypothetical protein
MIMMYIIMVTKARKPRARWTIARARGGFSELLRAAGRSPQVVYNRDRVVAVVVDPETFRRLAEAGQRSLGDAFAELRSVGSGADSSLIVAERTTRPDEFADVLDELAR